MRFLKGVAGAWAALTLCNVAITLINNHSLAHFAFGGVAVVNLVFAFACGMLTYVIEKPTWKSSNYAFAGVCSAGVLLWAGFCVIAAAMRDIDGAVPFGFADYAVTALTSIVSGALAGFGYKLLSGPHPGSSS
jgi:hypothetical protein